MKKKILVVEDEKFLLDLYIDLLKKEGYEVDSADDGETALLKMSAGGFDLVLLDIVMPKMDGYAVLKELKIHPPEKPNKKIALLTNLQEPKLDELVKQGEVNGYLIKASLTPDQFLLSVKHYLQK